MYILSSNYLGNIGYICKVIVLEGGGGCVQKYLIYLIYTIYIQAIFRKLSIICKVCIYWICICICIFIWDYVMLVYTSVYVVYICISCCVSVSVYVVVLSISAHFFQNVKCVTIPQCGRHFIDTCYNFLKSHNHISYNNINTI